MIKKPVRTGRSNRVEPEPEGCSVQSYYKIHKNRTGRFLGWTGEPEKPDKNPVLVQKKKTQNAQNAVVLGASSLTPDRIFSSSAIETLPHP